MIGRTVGDADADRQAQALSAHGDVRHMHGFAQPVAERFAGRKQRAGRDHHQLAAAEMAEAVFLADLAGEHGDEELLQLADRFGAVFFA